MLMLNDEKIHSLITTIVLVGLVILEIVLYFNEWGEHEQPTHIMTLYESMIKLNLSSIDLIPTLS